MLIDGETLRFQHKTQFDNQDDLSFNLKWLNTSDYGQEILSTVQSNRQYKFTDNGKTLIISSNIACSFELDYRQLDIPTKAGMHSKIINRAYISFNFRIQIKQFSSDAFRRKFAIYLQP